MTLPQLTRALLRKPASTLADGITTQIGLGGPTLEATLRQFDAYVDVLRSCGLEVTILSPDDRFPDGHFVEDAAVIFKEMAFMAHPGIASRAGEIISIAESLSALNLVRPQNGKSRLEGGDVLFCEDRVLIGVGNRTNQEGAEELRMALHSVQQNLKVEFVSFSGVLHLKTGVTEIAPGVLLRDPAMKTDFNFDFAEVIALPPREGYAANVLPINGTVLIADGYPTVRSIAHQHAAKVIAVEMDEFRKMDGSLTCLSLRY
jgi:dimethylargininase